MVIADRRDLETASVTVERANEKRGLTPACNPAR